MQRKIKNILRLILILILMMIILTPTVSANKEFSIVPWDTDQWRTPIERIIDGIKTNLFCIEHNVYGTTVGSCHSIGIGNVQDGDTLDERPSRPGQNNTYYLNAADYESHQQFDLPKYLAYIITKEDVTRYEDMTKEQKRLLQYVIWTDPNLNYGQIFGISGQGWQSMDSYYVAQEAKEQLQHTQNMKVMVDQIISTINNQQVGVYISNPLKVNTSNYAGNYSLKEEKQVVIDVITGAKEKFEACKKSTADMIQEYIRSDRLREQIDALLKAKDRCGEFAISQKDKEERQAFYDRILNIMNEELLKELQEAQKEDEAINNEIIKYFDALIEEVKQIGDQNIQANSQALQNIIKEFNDSFTNSTTYTITIEDENGNKSTKQTTINGISNKDTHFLEILNKVKVSLTERISSYQGQNGLISQLEKDAKQEFENVQEAREILYLEGRLYENYYKSYISSDGTLQGEPTEYPNQVKDLTDADKVRVIADYENQTYKIGPFAVQYPDQSVTSPSYSSDVGDGTVEDKSTYLESGDTEDSSKKTNFFDWIDDIYLVDKTGRKKENIKILTDKNKLTGPENDVPASGEEFWIEFKNEFDDGGTFDMKSLKVKIHFNYLKNCYGKYDLYVGYGEEFDWVYKYDPITHTSWYEAESQGQYRSQYLIGIEARANRIRYDETGTPPNYKDVVTPTREYDEYEIDLSLNNEFVPLTMELGGLVFEDSLGTKESVANGLSDIGIHGTHDVVLPGVKVSLYEYENGQIGKLATLASEDQQKINVDKNDPDREVRANPTLTDENGRYLFKGVDPMKKYIVMFTYNGQDYVPTQYKVGSADKKDPTKDFTTSSQNQDDPYKWRVNSKATETNDDRNEYDKNFASIGSSPENYKVRTDIIEDSALYLEADGYYNKTYSEEDLAGIELQPDGNKTQSGYQLIDTFLKVENGKVIDTKEGEASEEINPEYKAGLITQKITEYMNEHKVFPTDMKNEIYQEIVDEIGGDTDETWRKIQFIEDCKINSYTGDSRWNNDSGLDVYPIYDKFVISDEDYTFDHDFENEITLGVDIMESRNKSIGVYPIIRKNRDTITETYKAIYDGQYHINLGLWLKPQADMALRKDVYKATLKINGKTQTYQYNENVALSDETIREFVCSDGETLRGTTKEILNQLAENYGTETDDYKDYKRQIQEEEENSFWDIQARILGYADYYDKLYNRELYESDFKYPDAGEEEQLQAFITYKITIRNQSQSTLTQIDEIVDYYDSDYEYRPEYSWVMYKNYNGENNTYIRVKDQEYYDIMTQGIDSSDRSKYRPITSDGFDVTQGQYSPTTHNTLVANSGQQYSTLYVDGLKDKKLESGESAYVYLTFQVKGRGSNLMIDSPDPIEVTSLTDPGKQNIAEINGYSTYYASGIKFPNGVEARDDGNDTTNDIPVMYITSDNGQEEVYRDYSYAGLIDVDSNPGNFTSDELNNTKGTTRYEQNFEDDTDRSKGIRIFIEKGPLERIVSGVVWEDKRDVKVNDALVADGIRDEQEARVKDIRVDLLEVALDENGKPLKQENGDVQTKGIAKIYNGSNFSNATTYTNENGEYTFKGFIPGDYIVRFTYSGDASRNNPEYNGQDYKSTTYQFGIDQNGQTDITKEGVYYGYTQYGSYSEYGQNSSGAYGYDIYKADNNPAGNVSDAKDIWWSRQNVIDYSKGGDGVTSTLAETLDDTTNFNEKTAVIAETGVIRAEFEYNRQNSTSNKPALQIVPDDSAQSGNGSGNNNNSLGLQIIQDADRQSNNDYRGTDNYRNADNYKMDYGLEIVEDNSTGNYNNGTYHIQNVDFGLEERPKAGLELNKNVSNVIITLADGKVLFDATQSAQNLIWQSKSEYNINDMKDKADPGLDTVAQEVKEGKENVYSDYRQYKNFRQAVLDRVKTAVTTEKGIIQASMDEEIMHGATIQVTYDIGVKNIGEVDYRDTQFYYLGKVADESTIVKTSAMTILDYVANNLQFREDSNDKNWGWATIENNEIKSKDYVNSTVEAVLKDYNTIIETSALNKQLIPITESTKNSDDTHTDIKLILTQLITSQNTSDDLSYGNIAEIVKISNDVGRRMAFSVQGNQNPNEEAKEPDASRAEQVTILPPFGETYYYFGLGVFIVTLLAVSIVVIIKVVLKKRN